MKVILIHSKYGSQGHLATIMNRVREFCIKYHSDADPDMLAETLAEAYFSENPGMMCFAAIDDNGVVIAHAMATIESYFGLVTVNIIQYWKDRGIKFDEKIYNDFFDFVSVWARANGAKVIRMTARNRAVANILSRLGFSDEGRVIMTRPLNEKK